MCSQKSRSWEGLLAVVVSMISIALASLLIGSVSRFPTDQSLIVKYAMTHHAQVWFADEQGGDGRYYHSDPLLFHPPARRIIHGINLDEDAVPTQVLQAISASDDLRWLVVSPPVALSPIFGQVREKLRHTRILVRWTPRDAPVRMIDTEVAFSEVIAGDRVLLLLYSGLSIDAARARSPFCELAAAWADEEEDVDFVILDLMKEGFSPFRERLNEWFSAHEIPELGYHGYGKAIWISHGHALHWEWLEGEGNIPTLVETTHRVFHSGEVPLTKPWPLK